MQFRSIIAVTLTSYFMTACGGSDSIEPPASQSEQNSTEISSQLDEPISAGTLSVILIVPGSGPTDLNGNGPLGLNSNTYRRLANDLSEKGISTIRVDKRGMFSSAQAGDPNAVTVDIYAQDYRNWTDVILAETGRPCIYMLGHSEGALMVTAASIENENICGLILVAGVGRSFGDVIREQLKANPANAIIMEEALEIIETLERGERADTSNIHPALRPLFAEQLQDFMISLMQVDPVQLAKEASKKTLIIQGSTDLQVSLLDAENLTQATGGKLVLIDGMNHVLKDAPKNRWENLATYGNPDLPLSEGMVEAIRDFVEP